MSLASIMIVTYNRLELTKQTFQSIIENTDYPFEVVIVDNGSTDGTVEYLQDFCHDNFEKFKIHLNHKNLGIAQGRNLGLHLASSHADWLVTLDNDVELPKGWLTKCVRVLEKNPDFAMMGVNFEGVNYTQVTKNGVTFEVKPQGNLGTACMVFNRTLFKSLGYFNTEYKFYAHEDADYGFRTRVLGYKLGYIPDRGQHLGEGANDQGEYRTFKNKYHQENLNKFYHNCRLYLRKEKSLFFPFSENVNS